MEPFTLLLYEDEARWEKYHIVIEDTDLSLHFAAARVLIEAKGWILRESLGVVDEDLILVANYVAVWGWWDASQQLVLWPQALVRWRFSTLQAPQSAAFLLMTLRDFPRPIADTEMQTSS